MVKITLKELINRVSWAKIEEKMFAIYPEECDTLHYYKRLYWTLSNLEADENPTNEIIEFELLSEDEDVYYDDFDDDFDDYEDDYEDEFDEELGMSVEKWKKYLGHFIPSSLLEEIEEAEVIAHAFVEATYGGFKEAETLTIEHHDKKED